MQARFAVICVLGLAWVSISFYLGGLAASPQLLAKSVGVSEPGKSTGAADPIGPTAPAKIYYLPIEEQQLAEMYTRITADEAAFDAGKYWLLAAWAILVALAPLSGSLYVAREIASARESLTEKIEGRLTALETNAAATITAAQAQSALINRQG